MKTTVSTWLYLLCEIGSSLPRVELSIVPWIGGLSVIFERSILVVSALSVARFQKSGLVCVTLGRIVRMTLDTDWDVVVEAVVASDVLIFSDTGSFMRSVDDVSNIKIVWDVPTAGKVFELKGFSVKVLNLLNVIGSGTVGLIVENVGEVTWVFVPSETSSVVLPNVVRKSVVVVYFTTVGK